MAEELLTEALRLLAETETAADRRVVCAVLVDSSPRPWSRFFRSKAHLIMRGGQRALLQQALCEPAASPVRTAAEAWYARQPTTRLRLWPLGGSRPVSALDACTETLEPMVGYTGDIGGIAQTGDGTRLYAHAYGTLRYPVPGAQDSRADWNAILLEWDAMSGELLRACGAGQYREDSSAIALSPSAGRLAIRNHRSIELRDTADLRLERQLRGCEGPYGGITFLDDDRLAALDGSTLQLWTVSGDVANTDSAGMWAFAVNPMRSQIAVAGGRVAAIALHDLPGGELARLLGEHRRAADRAVGSAIAFHPDGRGIFVGDWNGHVRIWSSDTDRPQYLGQHDARLTCGRFSDDGRLLFTGDDHGQVYVWSVDGLRRVNRLKAHTGAINALIVDSTRAELLTCGADGRIRRWAISELDANPQFLPPHTIADGPPEVRVLAAAQTVFTVAGPILAWTPRGERSGPAGAAKGERYPALAVEPRDGALHIEQLALTLPVPEPALSAGTTVCVLDPTKRIVLTSHEDRSLRAWDAVSGAAIECWELDDECVQLGFYGQTTLIAIDRAGHVQFWELRL